MSMNIGGCGNIGISVGAGNGAPAALSAPVNVVLPAISGTLQVGDTLTSTTGTWTGNPAPTYIYRWKRGVTTIGTNSPTYVLVEADAGLNITCEVDATNSEGGPITAVSNILVPNALAAPTWSVNPVISGTGTVGQTLTLTSLGTAVGNPDPTYDTGQWQRDNVDISGETASTYLLAAPDAGTNTTNEVTASNSQGSLAQDSNTIAVAGAGAPVVANQTPDFGLLTQIGEGAWAPVNTGGPITSAVIDSQTNAGEFTINSDGTLEPLAALTAGNSTVQCTYNGTVTATHTVSKSADTYSVTDGEFTSVMAIGTPTLDGKTVLCRPNSTPIGDTPFSSYEFPAALTFTTGFTVGSHDITQKGRFRRLRCRAAGILNLDDIEIYDGFDWTADTINNSLFYVAAGSPTLNFDGVDFYGDAVSGLRYSDVGTGVFNGDGAGGGTLTNLDFSSMGTPPDLSQISSGAKIILNTQTHTSSAVRWSITSVDDVLKTMVVPTLADDGVTSIGALLDNGTVDFSIGDIHALSGVTKSGGAVNPTANFVNCTFTDLAQGIVLGGSGNKSTTFCTFDDIVGDAVHYVPVGTETLVTNTNVFGKFHALATDPQSLHVDVQQWNNVVFASDNTVAYEFIGNRILSGGRSAINQILLCENTPATRRIKVKCEHNVGLCEARNALVGEFLAAGSSYKGNTTLYDHIGNPGTLTPYIILTDDLAGVECMYNACAFITSTNATKFGNKEYGILTTDNESADYALDMDGTNFTSTSFANVAAMETALTPNGTGALDPANQVGIGALHGYYNYTTGVADAPWEETGQAASFTDQTDVAISTLTEHGDITMAGLSSTGAEVWSESGDIRIRTGGDVDIVAWTSGANRKIIFNGEKLNFRHTSSGSNSTATNQIVHIGANSDTFTLTTVAAGATELIPDPGFDTPGSWTAGGGWSVSGSAATFATGAAFDTLQGNPLIISGINGGNQHTISIDVTSITVNAGNFVLRATEENGTNSGTTHQNNSALSTGVRTHVFTPHATCTEMSYKLLPLDGTANFTVDDASMKEI